MAIKASSSQTTQPPLIFFAQKNLNKDVMMNILSFLPIKEIPKLAVLNTSWRQLVGDLSLWRMFAARVLRTVVPPPPEMERKQYYSRRIALNQFFNDPNQYAHINREFSIPNRYLTYEDETQTTYLLYVQDNKILSWNPLCQRAPEVLFEHPDELSIWRKAEASLSPDGGTSTHLICSSKNSSGYFIFLIDLKSKRCLPGPVVNYNNINCILFFDHSVKSYLLIHSFTSEFEVWDLQDKKCVRKLPYLIGFLCITKNAQGIPYFLGMPDHRPFGVYDLISDQENVTPLVSMYGNFRASTSAKNHQTKENFILINDTHGKQILVLNTNVLKQEVSFLGLIGHLEDLDTITVGDKDYIIGRINIKRHEIDVDEPRWSKEAIVAEDCIQVWDFLSRKLIINLPLTPSFYTNLTSYEDLANFRVVPFPNAKDHLLLFDNVDLYLFDLQSEVDLSTGYINYVKKIPLHEPFDHLNLQRYLSIIINDVTKVYETLPRKDFLTFFNINKYFGVPYLLCRRGPLRLETDKTGEPAKTTVIDLGALVARHPKKLN